MLAYFGINDRTCLRRNRQDAKAPRCPSQQVPMTWRLGGSMGATTVMVRGPETTPPARNAADGLRDHRKIGDAGR
jgi:hypothetical protein